MRLVKVGMANTNPTVGRTIGNADQIISACHKMSNCTLGVFGEQVLAGYPGEDLVQFRRYVHLQMYQLLRIVDETRNHKTVFSVSLTIDLDGEFYNAIAVFCEGCILGFVPKEALPDYNVFYENRTHTPGTPGMMRQLTFGHFPNLPHDRGVRTVPVGDMIFQFPFGTVAYETCEDIWKEDGPMGRRSNSGAELIVNQSASPFRNGVFDTRSVMVQTRSADNEAVVVYVNIFGGQDNLVFDGGSIVAQNGKMLRMGDISIGDNLEQPIVTSIEIDLDETARRRAENTTWRRARAEFLAKNTRVPTIDCTDWVPPMADPKQYQFIPDHGNLFMPEDRPLELNPRHKYFTDIEAVTVIGLRDYRYKTGAFPGGYLAALSGGKDSAAATVIAKIAARQDAHSLLGPSPDPTAVAKYVREHVWCYSFPTRFNRESKDDARALATELGVSFVEESIEEEFTLVLEQTERRHKALGNEGSLSDVTVQNLQARIRGARCWAISNEYKLLWIQTSNMSEKAVKYYTLGGDAEGCLSLFANLPKSVLIEFLRFLGKKYELVSVADILNKKSSAELKDGQSDEDDLMPFAVLDACYGLFVGQKLDPLDVYRAIRQRWTDAEFAAMSAAYKPGMLKMWVTKFFTRFFAGIYGWVQCPLSIHLSNLDLDRERALQLPTVSSTQWLGLERIMTEPD